MGQRYKGEYRFGLSKKTTQQIGLPSNWSNHGGVHVIQDDGIRDEVHDLLLL